MRESNLFTGSYQISMDSEQSTFPVALDYVRCNGQENTLKDCIHFSHSYGCGHEDDLAVHCQPGYNLREYIFISEFAIPAEFAK